MLQLNSTYQCMYFCNLSNKTVEKTQIWQSMLMNMGSSVDDPAANKNIKKQISNSVKLNKEDMENEIN